MDEAKSEKENWIKEEVWISSMMGSHGWAWKVQIRQDRVTEENCTRIEAWANNALDYSRGGMDISEQIYFILPYKDPNSLTI